MLAFTKPSFTQKEKTGRQTERKRTLKRGLLEKDIRRKMNHKIIFQLFSTQIESSIDNLSSILSLMQILIKILKLVSLFRRQTDSNNFHFCALTSLGAICDEGFFIKLGFYL